MLIVNNIFRVCSFAYFLSPSVCTRIRRAKLLLQKFPQYATDFVFFTDKKRFSVTSLDNRQNKVSGRLRELRKKKLSVFFSAGTVRSATAWPPVNCACVPQLFEQLN